MIRVVMGGHRVDEGDQVAGQGDPGGNESGSRAPWSSAAPTGIVWVASYPKSGNTWTRCLIASLLSDGAEPDIDALQSIVPHPVRFQFIENGLDIDAGELLPDELVKTRIMLHYNRAKTERHLFKIHDHYAASLFPPEVTAGTIYIVRDPRDVAPSFADHVEKTLDDAIKIFDSRRAILARQGSALQPAVPQHLGRWSDHVASWLDHGPRPLLLLRYEDMLRDTIGETRRLARFLSLPDDEATIGRAVQACRFDRLRQREAETDFVERLPHMERFFRQGEAGAWRRMLTPEQAARIVAAHGPMMERLGYL